LFASLQNTYVTQLNGNRRADTQIMMHAVHLLAPGAINIPMVEATCTAEDANEGAPELR
jgi:hypothetical protein